MQPAQCMELAVLLQIKQCKQFSDMVVKAIVFAVDVISFCNKHMGLDRYQISWDLDIEIM